MDGAASPTRPGRRGGWREKTRPARGFQRPFAKKTRPARPKTPKLECFECAGRTISRLHDETPPQGELTRVRTHTRPSRATNLAHRTQKHGEIETDDTSAPTNYTKHAHFPPTKAITVSIPHRHKRAKAIVVSDHRTTSPATPTHGTRGRRRGLARQRDDAPYTHQQRGATAVEGQGGPGGQGGLRDAVPTEARSSRLAGHRSLQEQEHPHSNNHLDTAGEAKHFRTTGTAHERVPRGITQGRGSVGPRP